ncbi:MAG: hypothetical protein ACYTFW_26975 [Planctomycetota bacterium]|jgi:hypothetical protein
MIEDAKKSGGVRWHFKSVQSSPGAFTTEPVYSKFTETIDVDRVAEKRYQPETESEYATYISLLLFPGQSAWVQVEVEYPADELMDPMFFAVEVISEGPDIKPANNRANMTLEIKYSDLTFDTSENKRGVEILGKRSEDNPQLNIRIKIRNIGEIDARDIVC